MYQAATKVNVLSPVMFIVGGVEAFHCVRKQQTMSRIGKVYGTSRGLRQWHGTRWNVCELGRSNNLFPMESIEGQVLKGEEFEMGYWKSDSLIVLGAGERPVHGKAVSFRSVRFSVDHPSLGGCNK